VDKWRNHALFSCVIDGDLSHLFIVCCQSARMNASCKQEGRTATVLFFLPLCLLCVDGEEVRSAPPLQ